MSGHDGISPTYGVLREENLRLRERLRALESRAGDGRGRDAAPLESHACQDVSPDMDEAVFDNCLEGLMFTSPDGRVFRANKAAQAMLGMSEAEICGRGRAGIADSSDPRLAELLNARELTGKASGWLRFRRGDGALMEVEASSAVFRGEGAQARTCISFRDVTQLAKAESERRAEMDRLLSMFENAPLAYQSLDENGCFLDVNRRWLETLGYEKSEVVGRWFGDFLGPGFVEHFDRNFPMFKSACVIDGVEFDMLRKDGSLVRVAFNGRVQLAVDGKFLRTHCIFMDITRRTRVEEALNFLLTSGWDPHGESFFDSLARYLSEALGMEFICIDTLDGDGLSASTLSVFHDGKFEDNISYALKDTPCGEAAGKTICTFTEKVHERFPHDELLQQMKAQSYLGTTLFSASGEAIGLIAAIGVKPLEDKDFGEHLIRMASIRAAGELERKLIRDDLAKSRESLRRSLEEKTVLMREVHHRVKNNLQILMSLVSLQASTILDPGVAEALDIMLSRIRSISMVHERLYRSHDLGAVDMKAYLEELVKEIARAFGDSGRRVEVFMDLDAVSMGVDRAIPLGLMVNELVTNAYKYAFAPDRPGRLELTLRQESADCLVRIQDDGPGLPQGFDACRAESMGMQLIQALCGQLKGCLEVSCQGGACFSLRFPHGDRPGCRG